MIPVLLVDGHNLMHRAEFGFPARIRSRSGRDITSVFGFYALLGSAIRALGVEEYGIVVCSDSPDAVRKAWARASISSAPDQPLEDFRDLHLVKKAAEALQVSWFECADHEADDLISTLAVRLHPSPVFIISTDRDFYQLVDDRVKILKGARLGRPDIVGRDDIRARYSVSPEQWCDYRALTGDPADGVPGVPGVGPKRAAGLLSEGQSLEDILSAPATGEGWMSWIYSNQELLLEWRDMLRTADDCVAVASAEARVSKIPPAKDVVGLLGLWDA